MYYISDCFKKTLFDFESYQIDPYGRGGPKSQDHMIGEDFLRVCGHIAFISASLLKGIPLAIKQGAYPTLLMQSAPSFL